VRITVDTNILIRAVVRDHPRQAAAAAKLLREAETIAAPLPCLCEFAWVLRSVYGLSPRDIHAAILALLNTANVAVNRPAVEAGLAVLAAGGDFADGLIAFEGKFLGGETFLSFDRKAVALLTKQGHRARVLA
jgi:predicted nucleic-acid-binding protein